jgi:cobalt-zinc-cadmium efflux system membrane fusion protein
MSAHIRIGTLLALATLAACRAETPPHTARTETATPAGETHAEEENAIHLSADMARDLRISTAAVSERPGAREVSVLGEVAVDEGRYAEVAPPTGGQVVQVLGELNAPVAAGARLAQLRSSEVGRARAELISTQARRDLAQQTLERKRSLAAERIVATREVQEAEAAARAADADTRAAAAALRALGVDEDDASADTSLFYVRTPVGGRIIDRTAIRGRFADEATALFTVADLSRVWLIARVFERDAVNLQIGSIAHVTLAALPGQEFDGRITQIGRQVDAGSRTVAVRVELANADGVLRPGMSANARLEVMGQTQTALVVPAAALQRVGERWLVFVPHGSEEFEMRPVGRGRDLGNDVEVVSGLKAGETVVVEGAFLLKAEAEKRAGGADEHGH